MRMWHIWFVLPLACGLLMLGQEGPVQQGSATVAKPRKKDAPAEATPETPETDPNVSLPKIPLEAGSEERR